MEHDLFVRAIYRRWREEGWLRGTVLMPMLLALAFIVVFSWGFYLTGHYDVEPGTEQADTANTSSDFQQRLWATLAMFTGAYISLNPDWDPMPPADLSIVGILALTLTLITAGSLLLLSRRVQDFIRVVRSAARLVVIGNGSTAAALVKSSIDRDIPTILVTDSRASDAARATKPSIPIIASGQIESALSTPSARRVIRHAHHVVVATDSDGLNMQLHKRIRDIRSSRRRPRGGSTASATSPIEADDTTIATARPAPKDLVVIHDPEYAQLLRPNSIRGSLPSDEVSCPAENIAEHICHLIVAVITGAKEVSHATVRMIHAQPSGMASDSQPSLAPTIETWVSRLAWSLSFVHGDEGRNDKGPNEFERIPALELVSNNTLGSKDGLLVQIFTGRCPSAVATQALTHHDAADLRIVLADKHLTKGAAELRDHESPGRLNVWIGQEWLKEHAPMNKADESSGPLILVVDPDEVGLDAALVTDDTGTQWARTFDLTYGLMFSRGASTWSVTGWQPGAPMGESTNKLERQRMSAERRKVPSESTPAQRERDRQVAREVRKEISNRYSSKLAAEHMLQLLSERGYELRRWDGDGPPTPPPLSVDDIEYIAEAEHEGWLRRTWTDTSRLRRKVESVSEYSDSGAKDYCYRGLVMLESEADPNMRLRFAANYNRRIASETYPAIAASFGYSIVRLGEPYPGKAPSRRCDRTECPCKKES